MRGSTLAMLLLGALAIGVYVGALLPRDEPTMIAAEAEPEPMIYTPELAVNVRAFGEAYCYVPNAEGNWNRLRAPVDDAVKPQFPTAYMARCFALDSAGAWAAISQQGEVR